MNKYGMQISVGKKMLRINNSENKYRELLKKKRLLSINMNLEARNSCYATCGVYRCET